AGLQVPGKADGVAQSFRIDFQGLRGQVRLLRIEAYQSGIEGVRLSGGVGGAADGQIEHAIRAKLQGAVRVLTRFWQVAENQLRLVQLAFFQYRGPVQLGI